jgi:hypothetical protein
MLMESKSEHFRYAETTNFNWAVTERILLICIHSQ